MNSILIRSSDALPAIIMAILLLALSGCATPIKEPEPLSTKQISKLTAHQQQLAQLNHWSLKGRMAIRYNGDSWNATIHWQKSPDHYDIQLFLPLGQGSLHLSGDNQSATLETSDGERFEGVSGEDIFYQQFGFNFPINALHDWIIGRPSNIKADVKSDANEWLQRVDSSGRMLELEQDDWNLRILRYKLIPQQSSENSPNSLPLPLPQKIFLNQNGNSLRLVIQEWQIDG